MNKYNFDRTGFEVNRPDVRRANARAEHHANQHEIKGSYGETLNRSGCRVSFSGENCGGCGASGGQIVRVEAADPIGCAAGDTVVVESSTAHVLGAAALVYLLPMLTMIIGYGFGISSGNALGQIFSTLLGFALGLVPAVYLDRRTKKEQKTTFRILEKL